MGKAVGFGVFVHRADSIYEDSPATQYQFPKPYLSRAQTMVGDWVIYYEPTKVVGSQGYFAVAKVAEIRPDPKMQDMYVALIEPGSYLDFADPVPFKMATVYWSAAFSTSSEPFPVGRRPRSAQYLAPISTASFHEA